ncbi:MAG: hypothetical protein ACOYI9_12325 [Candidatus Hydrogenedentales bacterium]|jgi:radical SAM protein with 4Fe4S-binding SPASM domain
MDPSPLHRFEIGEQRFVMDIESCFCFECDHISWDVLEYYPREPVNRIYQLLAGKYPQQELEEVVGELEWLRVTKAILIPRSDQELLEQATLKGGLQDLSLCLRPSSAVEEHITKAGMYLLARSEKETDLSLSLFFPELFKADWKAAALRLDALRRAALQAKKKLRIEISAPIAPPAELTAPLKEHQYRCVLTPAADTTMDSFLEHFMINASKGLKAIQNHMDKKGLTESLRVIVQPASESFEGVGAALYKTGCRDITIDLTGAWAEYPNLDPSKITAALQENAAWYVKQILRNTLFRFEPIASLFNAIYLGSPQYRADKSGAEWLAMDSDGTVYPSFPWLGKKNFALGALSNPTGETMQQDLFPVGGALQTPQCLSCWVRGLCGGANAAIHFARTGNVNTPDPLWCEGQRQWIASAVAVFNQVSETGVNFSQLVASMQPQKGHLSLRTAAKALFQDMFSVRPLRENDAPMLVGWENWNRAAYFACSNHGVLTATLYDREMDALHPIEFIREMIILRKDGSPCGLIKFCPSPDKKLALAWLYLHDAALYEKKALRNMLKTLVAEICRKIGLRCVLVPVTQEESALADALCAAGFVKLGTEREALYQRGTYRDVDTYGYTADNYKESDESA